DADGRCDGGLALRDADAFLISRIASVDRSHREVFMKSPTSSSSFSTQVGVELSDSRLFRQAAYVDGRWIDARTGDVSNVDNPATGEILGTVPNLHVADARAAIDAAARAFTTWRATTAKARAGVLRRWFDLILANQEDLARLVTLEQGKPLQES